MQRHKQRLKLLVTVLLARYRDLLPTVAARVPHAQFAAELISLPSGLLAMVSAAMVKLKVLLGHACVRVRVGWEGRRGPGVQHACQSIGGSARL